jgi:hypothetical protein
MQLVPILSTIILVGTLATFILAVSAYILYKMREKQGANVQAAPHAQQQEQTHVVVSASQQSCGLPAAQSAQTPAPASIMPTQAAPQQPLVPAQSPVQPEPQKSLFWEYTDEGFVPVQPRDESQMGQQMEEEQDDGFAWL